MNTLIVMFPYGKSKIKLKLPRENLQVIKAEDPPSLQNERQEIRKALLKPVKSEPLNKIVSQDSKVALIVSDITRPVPSWKIVPFILRELRMASVGYDKIKIVVATGMHRSNSEAEIELMLGKDVLRRVKVINHNAFDGKNLTYVGKTSKGTPLSINSTVFDADMKILTGYVEPHEFAGFTGGRKSILPGVSGINTIDKNHGPNMLTHPKARIGILDGNPVHEDMVEAAKMVGVNFIVNVVLNSRKKIVKVASGDFMEAHLKAVEFYKKYGAVTVSQLADIVIASTGYPLDMNLYQSVKALIAAENFVKKDGTIILLAECREGVGAPSFHKCLKISTSPDDMLKNAEEIAKLKKHYADLDHCYLLARILKKCKVITVSQNSSVKEVNKALMATTKFPKEALNTALESHGNEAKVIALPYATRVIPKDSFQ